MILRKPYAFLIKYFKIIHILLFGIFAYLIFYYRKIYLFLVSYVKKGTFNYTDNIAEKYVPILMMIFLLIVIVAGIFIYSLMKKKNKPSLFYVLLTGYSSLSFILMIIFRSFFVSLELTAYETLSIIIYRDIMAFLYFSCYFFVGFLFIRAFGFDIKKFSFDKDKRELNLDTSDNEEVELGMSFDKYDALKELRKEKRELSYYYQENKTIINTLAIVLGVSLVLYLFIHFFVNNRVYSMKSTITLGNIDFKIKDSFVTNLDSSQNVISSKNYFLVLNLEINNKNNQILYFDREIFRISNGDEYVYPVSTYCKSFSDIGNCYTENSKINIGSQEYVVVFKINNDFYNGYFEILKNKKDNYNYEKMKVNSNIIDVSQQEYDMHNDYFNIDSYKISDYETIKYNECVDNNCVSKSRSVYVDLNNKIIVLNVTNLNEFEKDFLENYMGFYYYVNGKKYDVSSSKISVLDINENSVYISVPKISLTGDNMGISFRTRRKDIYIKLSENNG